MANSVFLDTSGWIALLHTKDANHQQAETLWQALGSRGCSIILTDWIIAETGNGLARSSIREQFCDAIDRIYASPRAEVILLS